MSYRLSQIAVAVGLGLLALVGSSYLAKATTIVGGSLLSSGDANFIASAISPNDLTFTNIYTFQNGEDAYNFHTATDGHSNLVVIGLTSDGLWGGYNPISWSGSGYIEGISSAFVFSLNPNIIFEASAAFYGPTHPYALYASPNYFPTWGGGHDLTFQQEAFGYHNVGYSYGSLDNAGQYTPFRWSQLEIFEVSGISPVPGPVLGAGLPGILMALGGLIAWRRRRLAAA